MLTLIASTFLLAHPIWKAVAPVVSSSWNGHHSNPAIASAAGLASPGTEAEVEIRVWAVF